MEKIKSYISELGQAYNIPEALVVAAPIFLLFIAIFLTFLAVKLLEPKYRLYKQDSFYNLIWKWKWKKDEIVDLWCYCPTCKSMLYVDDENCKTTSTLGDKITFFICHECNESEKGRIRGGDRRFALSVIKREILGKVRNKTFDIYLDL
jgi:uncharacterized protein YbaR (Trm112 family)